MSAREQNNLQRIRSEVEAAVAAALREHPKAELVIVLPIIVECEFPKPRMPYGVWIINQMREAEDARRRAET